MTDKPFSLDVIDVASPCTADWGKMQGTDHVRRCAQCELNVYHLSNLTRDAAESLLLEHEGRLCVRFYRRADGTVLTRDCPIGLQAIRRQLARLVAGVAAMIAFLVAGITFGFSRSQSRQSFPEGYTDPTQLFPGAAFESGPIGILTEWLDPSPTISMGVFALPPTKSPPPTMTDPTP
jgi:hypothetical protein